MEQFEVLLPKPINEGDEITVRGTLKDNPSQVSFNFRIDDSPSTPVHIALHFKTKFLSNAVVLNFKNNVWGQEERYENFWYDGDGKFHFTFLFKENGISIYRGGGTQRMFLYQYEHQLPYSHIKRFQIWDDLEAVTELTFRYSNEQF